MKKIVLMPYLCPPLAWFVIASRYEICLEVKQNYQKKTLLNRMYIGSVQGQQLLSVPLLKGKNAQTPIDKVGIAYYEPWQRRWWNSLEFSYSKSPYFEFYAEELKAVMYKKVDLLVDFNKNLLEEIFGFLDMKKELDSTRSYEKVYDEGMDYRHVFDANGIAATRVGLDGLNYRQMHAQEGRWMPNLSILDALFNLGPEVQYYI